MRYLPGPMVTSQLCCMWQDGAAVACPALLNIVHTLRDPQMLLFPSELWSISRRIRRRGVAHEHALHTAQLRHG